MSLFVDVALRAASILKNRVFMFLSNYLHVVKLPNLLGFEHREYASLLSFEKCCRKHLSTSQTDVWSLSYDHISCGAIAQKNSRKKKLQEPIDYTSVNQVWLRPEPKKQPEAI